MTPQGGLTIFVAILTIIITMGFFYYTVATTPKHGFYCSKCGKELPASAMRCNDCGTTVANADQII
jgi:predicted amidophosphoribosyltransferase